MLLAACTSESPLSEVNRVVSALKRAWERCRTVEAFQGQRLPRCDGHRLGCDALTLQRISRHRKERGKVRGVDLLRVEVIRGAPGPSSGAVALRDRSLPLQLLVGMRKQIERDGRLRPLILRSRERLHQRTCVRHHRQLFARKHAGHFRQLAVKGEWRVRNAVHGGGQLAGGERQATANGGVRLIAGVVHGDDGVVRIVSSEQEHAHQRSIVRATLRHGWKQAEGTQGQRSHGCRACSNKTSS